VKLFSRNIWQDKNVISSVKRIWIGLSVGIKAPSGIGKQLIITHIGNTDEFMKDGLSLFITETITKL
jgi:hypothetical protein